MTAFSLARPGLIARLFLAFLILLGLGSCGSGGVSPVVNDPTRITIQPDTAIMYSGLPTTFIVSGGTGAYIVTSSNQAVLQVSGAISPSPITVFANPVITDTPVTLTVRDTGTAPLATATLTVRPNTVNNNITITPSPTQGGNCAPAVCSGGDALLSATISQGGIPLPARGVRLEVISGDFRFIVTPLGSNTEILSTSIDVVTDEQGRVRERLRALADAPNQTALVQVTDLGTGAFQRSSFIIAQFTGTSPGFFVTPSSVTFSGRFVGQCANNLSAVFSVFGGVPPYTILNSAGTAFVASQSVVAESGGDFAVTARGICTAPGGMPIVVRDSAGRTTTVTVANLEGTAEPTPVVVSPDAVFIEDCTSTASVTISGGTGSYFASSGSNAFLATASGSTLTIRRRPGTASSPSGPIPSPVLIGVSDGRTSASVSVEHSSGTFPVCPSSTLAVSPPSVTLASCGPVTLTVSGGAGSYSAASNNSSVAVVQTTLTTFNVQRAPSADFTPPATVTISDGTTSRFVTVNATGAGPGSGTGPCP